MSTLNSTNMTNEQTGIALVGIATGFTSAANDSAHAAAYLVRCLVKTVLSTGCNICNVHVAFHVPTSNWLVSLAATASADSEVPVDADWTSTIEAKFRGNQYIAAESVRRLQSEVGTKQVLHQDWQDRLKWERGTLVFFHLGEPFFLERLGNVDFKELSVFNYIVPETIPNQRNWRDPKTKIDLTGLLDKISPRL
ncbi:uncharacterized protein DSM5745_11385 [Aspergillus mulundensis]|uniref:Uncharacterized protein n=1 Tax=Aspergillus mulundensis TaxID=1810919 RepID=A0A3D8Q879_9EURO|nr:hypothetical protein DSM5745_11385 [Aspergillus mulundensis]RDW57867.1 hypothetical protein DSM5745_11385 [Aspergillus mulundensis]